eukprot:SAG11_NODE_941_length_6455_cov_5.508181_5_plen_39_part_00
MVLDAVVVRSNLFCVVFLTTSVSILLGHEDLSHLSRLK